MVIINQINFDNADTKSKVGLSVEQKLTIWLMIGRKSSFVKRGISNCTNNPHHIAHDSSNHIAHDSF